jgi:hypothetical protein
MAGLLGGFKRDDNPARLKYINRFVWIAPLVPVVLFFVFRPPVNMVKADGVAHAAMLPILSIGALYLRHKRLPKEVAPNRLSTVALWIAAAPIIIVVGYPLGRELWVSVLKPLAG